MKAIICKNALGYIGDKGKLIWHCKEELQHFARLTKDSTVLVGFNTFLQLPRLKNRIVRIDPRDGLFQDLQSVEWCIGGRKTYEKYAHLFTELHVSTITDNYDKGDTLYPTLANLNPNCKIFNYQFTQ
jgi:dihydrofolate reductase